MTSSALDRSLLQSSRVMAYGTLLSRLTGLARTIVLVAALGVLGFADTYNVANTIPNIVYELLLGGVLTSVVVPLLVEAARRDGDDGQAYAQRLLTLVALMLGVISAIGVGLAPYIVRLYSHGFNHRQLTTATTFARFFLPQIVFYGVGATMGAILNVRGRFAAPMWAPILNNVVVIVTGLVFLALPGTLRPGHLTTTQTLTLGIGTTAGVVLQTIALVPSLRAVGFRWRTRFDFRHAGLGKAGRLGAWVFLYVLVNQLGFLVVVNLATSAGSAGHRFGFSPYIYAFALFQVPHAVVAVSIITALLPRMSAHAVDGRLEDVRADLAQGVRLTSAVIVPAMFAFFAVGRWLSVVLFSLGHSSVSDARYVGLVLIAYAVGLLPFSLFQLHLRAFYALHDTRTPALINIGVNVANLVVDIVLYVALPPHDRVIGLAFGYSASYFVGFFWSGRSLASRIGSAYRKRTATTLVRLTVAATLGAIPAYVVGRAVTYAAGAGIAGSTAAAFVGLAAGGAIFYKLARRMRVTEVDDAVAMLRRRAIGRSTAPAAAD